MAVVAAPPVLNPDSMPSLVGRSLLRRATGDPMNKATSTVTALALTLSGTSALHGAELATILLPQDQEVQMALEAGPEHVRDAASVFVFGKDGYRKVRNGSNGFTCLVNRDGNQKGDNDLKPTCWDAEGSRTIVPVMLRVGELIARSASQDEVQREIDAGYASGKFSAQQKAGIAYMLAGDIQFDPETRRMTGKTTAPPHYMIYSPGVSNADIGMETKPATSKFALPNVTTGYSGRERTAYIIVDAAPPRQHSH
jgi:hypothetical protein